MPDIQITEFKQTENKKSKATFVVSVDNCIEISCTLLFNESTKTYSLLLPSHKFKDKFYSDVWFTRVVKEDVLSKAIALLK